MTEITLTQADEPLPGLRAVGVIGLGIMGSRYARHLIEAGFDVAGFDVAADRCEEFTAVGGRLCASPAEVIDSAGVVVVALSAVAAFRSVMLDEGAAPSHARVGQILVEMGTLPIALKDEARQLLVQRGAHLVDAPVTGTRIHAERKELVVYASGDEAVVARARPVLEAFARDVRFVGEFGTGMKLKMVTNHLVAVHNVAAAEALAFAASAGLDLRSVYDLIAGGPASSAVFGFRGPLMVEARYHPPTMRMDVFEKDLQIIDEFATALNAATPLFHASLGVYREALAQGMTSEDVAATFEILKARSRASMPPPVPPARHS
jgi:3-hydroxyisobutyrate dehydrogenase-like beta-hydroxyacid dehydrogenase